MYKALLCIIAVLVTGIIGLVALPILFIMSVGTVVCLLAYFVFLTVSGELDDEICKLKSSRRGDKT